MNLKIHPRSFCDINLGCENPFSNTQLKLSMSLFQTMMNLRVLSRIHDKIYFIERIKYTLIMLKEYCRFIKAYETFSPWGLSKYRWEDRDQKQLWFFSHPEISMKDLPELTIIILEHNGTEEITKTGASKLCLGHDILLSYSSIHIIWMFKRWQLTLE